MYQYENWGVVCCNSKVGEMKDNTRDERSSSMRKVFVGCLQDMVGKMKLLFKF